MQLEARAANQHKNDAGEIGMLRFHRGTPSGIIARTFEYNNSVRTFDQNFLSKLLVRTFEWLASINSIVGYNRTSMSLHHPYYIEIGPTSAYLNLLMLIPILSRNSQFLTNPMGKLLRPSLYCAKDVALKMLR